MTTLNETTHAGGHILSEANGNRSRENGTLKSGASLQAGTVLGSVMTAGAAVAGTNTGNGAVTVGSLGPDAQIGQYTLKCVAAAANAGTFQLISPNGDEVREITVGGGLSANDHVAITIADGATDFVAGDTFTIDVTLSGYKQLNTAATDGSQTASAILYAPVDASAADQPCVVTARASEVNGNELVWPNGISAGNKSAAIASLAGLGILVR